MVGCFIYKLFIQYFNMLYLISESIGPDQIILTDTVGLASNVHSLKETFSDLISAILLKFVVARRCIL